MLYMLLKIIKSKEYFMYCSIKYQKKNLAVATSK